MQSVPVLPQGQFNIFNPIYSFYNNSNFASQKKINTSESQSDLLETEHNAVYNMENLLADNILTSEYYKSLFRFQRIPELVDEFAEHAKNVEPRIIGYPKPSTAFCILYKLFTMKVNRNQITNMLDHKKPLVRCLGFLYLRYLLKPTKLWEYFESSFDDDTEVIPGADGEKTTVGTYAASLLKDNRYYTTSLPRIPKNVQLIFQREILRMNIMHKRDKKNESLRSDVDKGVTILAQYTEDWQFYEAVVDKCLDNGQFLVTFLEYGNQEEVSIGMIKLKKKSSKQYSRNRKRNTNRVRKHQRKRRSRNRDCTRSRRKERLNQGKKLSKRLDFPEALTNDILDDLIKKRTSKDAAAIGRNYAKTVYGLKRGISNVMPISTTRQRSPSPREMISHRRPMYIKAKIKKQPQKTLDHEAKVQLKQYLKQQYGDASAGAN